KHHPAILKFSNEAAVFPNWVGALTARNVLDLYEQAPVGIPSIESFGPEYFEWIDLLEAVLEAGDEFCMAELGAGWGRWTVHAFLALRLYYGDAIPRYHFVAVEPDPQHFAWMTAHVRRNGLLQGEGTCSLIQAAVGATDGSAPFHVGASAEWYGQMFATAEHPEGPPGSTVEAIQTVSLDTV